jgi:hypothetical protein
MGSGCSPAHIISTQSPNEVACFFQDTWPTWLSMANLPGPVPTETAAVPIDHGRRKPSEPTMQTAYAAWNPPKADSAEELPLQTNSSTQ